MVGFRYEVNVGGPAQLVARLSHVRSERQVINPVEPTTGRDLGIQAWPLYLADFGLSLNLTGQRSYRGIVPVIYTGIGLASDLGKEIEEDPYKLGTTFAFSVADDEETQPVGQHEPEWFEIAEPGGTHAIFLPAGNASCRSSASAVCCSGSERRHKASIA
jgi:hypothetical protein